MAAQQRDYGSRMEQLGPWQILAIAGLLLGTIEVFTPTFVTLPAGIAFLLTAGAGLVTDNWTVLLFVLVLNLGIVYWVFYKFVWPRMAQDAPKTGADAMAGKIATVTEALKPQGGGGYVKLYGDSWQAIADEAIPTGTRVMITALEGNKVIVRPLTGDETSSR